ncbi:unnamed protein product [Rotaria sp. Silwood2]|nr:unnamed protein product [Rotaria sp. Silwood2]CAF3002841.1 unnamed protein product [Rotaria sp. Silwood2]CAF3209630.1 unnamed protein product [Rotaria sp. Silwood2]CAF3338482.1 unnamed protein product [Rotaria sp. Silwood2]CAF4193845.1 unnamed protein product [Rotaria sp. Silwood2]
MNDKPQQTNFIRKFRKVYNIELLDNPSSSSSTLLAQTKVNGVYLTNTHENEKEHNMPNAIHMTTSIEPTPIESTPYEPTIFEPTTFEPTPFESKSSEQRPTCKRKSDEKLVSELLSQEIDSSK